MNTFLFWKYNFNWNMLTTIDQKLDDLTDFIFGEDPELTEL